MFHAVEKFQTPAKIILALISISFVGFGAYSLTDIGKSKAAGPSIVTIGSTPVTEEDLMSNIQNRQLEATPEVKESMFLQLVRNAYLIEGARDMGFVASEELITKELKEQILSAPLFQNEKGTFSKEKFDQYLKERNMTEARLVKQAVDASLKDSYLKYAMFLFSAGQIQSDQQIDRFLKLVSTNKEAVIAQVKITDFIDQIKPTDASLKTYYDANKERFVQTEAAKFAVVAIMPNDPRYAQKMAINPSDLSSTSETRQASHILIKFPDNADQKAKNQAKEKATKILAEVKASPDKFADLAKKYSEDPGSAKNGGDLGFFGKGMMVPSFEQKTFSMKKGEISDLVESPYGYHIIKLIDTKAKTLSKEELEAAKEKLKHEKFQALLAEESKKLEKLIGKDAASLEKEAKALGLYYQPAAPQFVAKEQLVASGSPEDIVETMFADSVIKNKKVSEIISDEERIYVVAAQEVRPYKQLSFDEAKNNVVLAYTYEEATKLAEKKAADILAKLQKGEAVDVAWSQEPELLSIDKVGPQLTPEAINQFMSQTPTLKKPTYLMSTNQAGVLLMKLIGTKEPEKEAVQAYIPQVKGRLFEANADFNVAIFLKSMTTRYKEIPGTQPSPLPKKENTKGAEKKPK